MYETVDKEVTAITHQANNHKEMLTLSDKQMMGITLKQAKLGMFLSTFSKLKRQDEWITEEIDGRVFEE